MIQAIGRLLKLKDHVAPLRILEIKPKCVLSFRLKPDFGGLTVRDQPTVIGLKAFAERLDNNI